MGSEPFSALSLLYSCRSLFPVLVVLLLVTGLTELLELKCRVVSFDIIISCFIGYLESTLNSYCRVAFQKIDSQNKVRLKK